jgi:hypothetical protein
MPSVLLRAAHWLVIAALFLAAGGHWAVLQTVAWGTMIVDYSQHASLGEAVQKTFDGQHPCGLCTQIQKSRDTEKKHEAQVGVQKIELFDHRVAEFVPARGEPSEQTAPDLSANARFQEPALRPPRAA